MEGVNVHNITDVIGIDKRISPYFFGYGTPFGGTCFPRDTSAFIKFAEDRGKDAKHLKFSNEVNESLYYDILNSCKNYKNIGIVGVSFKPNSPVTIGSPSARLIEDLVNLGLNVFVYDEIPESYVNLNGLVEQITLCYSAQDCVDNSDVVAIMHPNKNFSTLNVGNVKLIDFWGVINGKSTTKY